MSDETLTPLTHQAARAILEREYRAYLPLNLTLLIDHIPHTIEDHSLEGLLRAYFGDREFQQAYNRLQSMPEKYT